MLSEHGSLEANGVEVKFQFDPAELNLGKKIKWEPRAILNREVYQKDFVGGEGLDTELKLLFDEWHGKTSGPTSMHPTDYFVEARLLELEGMTKKDSATGTPPVCLFSYGLRTFECVIDEYHEISIKRNQRGDITRAIIQIHIMEQVFEEYHRTAREEKGEQFYLVETSHAPYNGMTFRNIAAITVGDPNLSEAILDYNHEIVLKNQGFIVEPGTEVVIPPWEFVKKYLKSQSAGLVAVKS